MRRAYELVAASGRRRVGMFGLSFKTGTDDLRESPMVALAERLIGRGYDLRIYDGEVATSRLVGANREYVDRHIPHLSRLMADSVQEVVDHAEVAVLGTRDPLVIGALAPPRRRLDRGRPDPRRRPGARRPGRGLPGPLLVARPARRRPSHPLGEEPP